MDYSTQSSDLLEKLSFRVAESGEEIAARMGLAAGPILEWIGYLNQSELTGDCDKFLDGVRSLVLEALCCASSGLYRSSILSMRGQIDLVLTWLYFKDHSIEWLRVIRENEGYRLKKDVVDYLREYYPSFEKSFSILKHHKLRRMDDPYRVLSAHIHSIGSETIPDVTALSDIVGSKEMSLSCVDLQSDVSEYINDVLLACYGHKWASLPNNLIDPAKCRVPSDKHPIVFG